MDEYFLIVFMGLYFTRWRDKLYNLALDLKKGTIFISDLCSVDSSDHGGVDGSGYSNE